MNINLENSDLILTGEVSDVEELVTLLRCRVSKASSTYLSLKLGTPFKSKIMWDVEEGVIL